MINYRKLNDITKKDSNTLPLIKDALDQILGSQYFTKIDLRDAFNQIQIRKGDK